MNVRQGIYFASLVAAMSATAIAADSNKLPSFATIESALVTQCAQQGLDRTDIISKTNAVAMLDTAAKLGWKIVDREALLKRVLPDNDYLVKELRKKQGRNFVKEIANMPEGLDRVDRMAREPQGKYVINMLVTHVDGDKMIGYMTGPTSNQRLANLLSAAPPNVDLNKPTGRLYTVDNFVQELKKLYALTK